MLVTLVDLLFCKSPFYLYLYCMTIPGITPFRPSRRKATTYSTDRYIGQEVTDCSPVGVVGGSRFVLCGTIIMPSSGNAVQEPTGARLTSGVADVPSTLWKPSNKETRPTDPA
jgi:hypothetical protein